MLLCGCAPETKTAKTANKDFFCGVWISCYELDKMINGGDFKTEFSAVCEDLKTLPVTDVFIHVRAFSDSLFPSKYYPQKENAKACGFDLFSFIISSLTKAGIRTHAWINPFRTANGGFLDPADEKVRARILCGIREITENYGVAGIHFDDYFYPADSEGIDEKSYAAYSETAACPLDKAAWRTANINALIFSAGDIIRRSGKDMIFSVSPAADTEKNLNSSFADVKAWCEGGAVDLVIPQLYFGFDYENEKFRFLNLIKEWKELINGGRARLVIGLAAYKLGTTSPPDSAEWQTGEDILARQVKACYEDSAVSGVCFFSFSYLFSREELNTAAREKVKNELNSHLT